MPINIPPGPLSANTAARLSSLLNKLEPIAGLKFSAPLSISRSGGFPLVNADALQDSGDGAGITVEDSYGASFSGIDTLLFNWATVTNPSPGVAEVDPTVASDSTRGIVSFDFDEWDLQKLGQGTKVADGFGIYNTEADKDIFQISGAPGASGPFSIPGVNGGKCVYLGRRNVGGTFPDFDGATYPALLCNIDTYWYREGASFGDTPVSAGVSDLVRIRAGSTATGVSRAFTFAHQYQHPVFGTYAYCDSLISAVRPIAGGGWIGFPTIPTTLDSYILGSNGYIQAKIGYLVGDGIATVEGATGTDSVGNHFTGGIVDTIGSGGSFQTGIQWQDEGSNLGTSGTVNTVDFVGSGFTASRAGNKVTVTGTAAPIDAEFLCLSLNGSLTNERSLVLESGVLSGADGGAGGNYTISIDTGGIGTGKLANNSVTFAKFQQIAALSLFGNPTGSTANGQAITLGAGLSFSGTTLVWTGTTGATAALIDGSAVTSGLVSTAGSGLDYAEQSLAPGVYNIFIGPGWTNIGLNMTIPSNGRYTFKGMWRGYIVPIMGGAGYMTAALFKNGILIPNSESILVVEAGRLSAQGQQPVTGDTTICIEGDIISLYARWNGGPLEVAQVVSGVEGVTRIECERIKL